MDHNCRNAMMGNEGFWISSEEYSPWIKIEFKHAYTLHHLKFISQWQGTANIIFSTQQEESIIFQHDPSNSDIDLGGVVGITWIQIEHIESSGSLEIFRVDEIIGYGYRSPALPSILT
eukprot:UN03494